jgi:asparagine synthase (glutamine-hydrolysing)
MSGICGVISLDGQPVPVTVVEAMAAAAPHRGRAVLQVSDDRSGVLIKQARVIGATPGETSRSPDRALVVADARIDNAPELRTTLLRYGYLREGAGDPEALIAAAYEAWGEHCADRMVGDFAFVIWDPQRRRVLAARDPLAMRSLFFRVEPSRRLLFATEAKQLLAAPGVPVRIFEPAVAADLLASFGRPEWSFYDGLEQLAPGHTLIVGPDGRRVRRFWAVDPESRVDCRGVGECAEELRRVFTDAVADRLDHESRTGVMLSGGVDSGSVASVAGWLVERGAVRTPGLHAFSWAFDELDQCDERHISRHIVDRYGFVSTDVPADDAGPLACFPEHLPDQDDPFLGGFQPLIEHTLAAARAEGVGVMLGGDRGDLVIGDSGVSYLRLLQARQARALKEEMSEHRRAVGDPWPLIFRRHLLEAVAGRLRRRTPREWFSWTSQKARRTGSTGPLEPQHPEWLRPSFLEQSASQVVHDDGHEVHDRLGFARRRRHDMIFTPLHLRGVAWSERTYARYGVSFADPFSDRRVVELALALPQSVINRPGDQSKPLMRAAMAGVMPERARADADKILPLPLYERGLRRQAALVRELLAHPQVEARGWVDGPVLREHYERWLQGGALRPEFWWTLQVEIWLRTHWQ